MKRSICTIKQYDYIDKAAFIKDIPKMKSKGYVLIEKGMCNGLFYPQPIHGGDDFTYTAAFIKDTLWAAQLLEDEKGGSKHE